MRYISCKYHEIHEVSLFVPIPSIVIVELKGFIYFRKVKFRYSRDSELIKSGTCDI